MERANSCFRPTSEQTRLDRQQGLSRLERAARWSKLINAAARQRGLPEPCSWRRLKGTGHSVSTAVTRGGLDGQLLDFLYHHEAEALVEAQRALIGG